MLVISVYERTRGPTMLSVYLCGSNSRCNLYVWECTRSCTDIRTEEYLFISRNDVETLKRFEIAREDFKSSEFVGRQTLTLHHLNQV